MSIILCDFMDPIWIDIFQKSFPQKTKKIFIDDNNFFTSLKSKNRKYHKFLLKNYCRRNLYYSNKISPSHHKKKFPVIWYAFRTFTFTFSAWYLRGKRMHEVRNKK